MRSLTVLFAAFAALIVCSASAQDPSQESSPPAKKKGMPNTDLLHGTGPLHRLQTSPRHYEWADIESAGGRKVHTFVVFPQVEKPATTIVVIHENRGLTDWVRGVADQLAEDGFLAVAPDLLSGTAPGAGNTPEFGSEDKAIEGIYKLPPAQVTADLDAVFDYAKELPASNKVVAVGGFCWGGGQTFNYATHNPQIAAAFVFYGPAPKDQDSFKNIKSPVYGFYGGKDFRITGEVPAVEKRLKQLGKIYEPVAYEGAGHAFMRLGEATTDAKDPNRKAHDQAWERLTKLLNELK